MEKGRNWTLQTGSWVAGESLSLQDIDFFKKVRVDPEIGTLVWPNEVDLCPDVLYSEAIGAPLPESNMAMTEMI